MGVENDEEFFHLFEASKRTGTKIMIAADRVPSGIKDIDERLRTRFEMGLVVEAPGKGLPQGAGELNLQEAPSEYMEDEDLWGGFMRPKVPDAVLPPVEDSELGEGAGSVRSGDEAEPGPASTEAPARKAEPAEAVGAAGVAGAVGAAGVGELPGPGSVWKPSTGNVVWDWQAVEERIVELTE